MLVRYIIVFAILLVSWGTTELTFGVLESIRKTPTPDFFKVPPMIFGIGMTLMAYYKLIWKSVEPTKPNKR